MSNEHNDLYDPEEVRKLLLDIDFHLRGPRVAMIRPKPEEKVGTGADKKIWLPDQAKRTPKFGTVVMSGEEFDFEFRYGSVPIFARIPIPLYETTQIDIELRDGRTMTIDILHEEEISSHYPTAQSLKRERELRKERQGVPDPTPVNPRSKTWEQRQEAKQLEIPFEGGSDLLGPSV